MFATGENQSCMNLQRHFIFYPVLIGNGEMKDTFRWWP